MWLLLTGRRSLNCFQKHICEWYNEANNSNWFCRYARFEVIWFDWREKLSFSPYSHIVQLKTSCLLLQAHEKFLQWERKGGNSLNGKIRKLSKEPGSACLCPPRVIGIHEGSGIILFSKHPSCSQNTEQQQQPGGNWIFSYLRHKPNFTFFCLLLPPPSILLLLLLPPITSYFFYCVFF